MREISLEPSTETGKVPRWTFCAYGPTRSGKTTFAASFPRVAFLSDVTESGYESLRGISDEFLFEPGVMPIVLGIDKMNDMATAREMLASHIRAGMVQTVVIDSATFYADLYLNYLFELQGPNQNNLKAYGALGIHLRDLRVKWHQMGCNVVWLCLPQDPDEDRPNGLPMIPGKEAGKFGASCDYLFYSRYDRFKRGNEFVEQFELHSRPFGKYVAGCRRSDGVPELPSPLVNATYTTMLQTMGYDAEAYRASLPAYARPKLSVPAVTAPPVQSQQTAQAKPQAAAAVAKPAAKPHVPNAARPAQAPQPSNGQRPAAPTTVTRRPAVAAGRQNNNQ